MKQIEPEREDQHGSQLKGEQIPFIAENRATVLGAGKVAEHLARLDCTENAA